MKTSVTIIATLDNFINLIGKSVTIDGIYFHNITEIKYLSPLYPDRIFVFDLNGDFIVFALNKSYPITIHT